MGVGVGVDVAVGVKLAVGVAVSVGVEVRVNVCVPVRLAMGENGEAVALTWAAAGKQAERLTRKTTAKHK